MDKYEQKYMQKLEKLKQKQRQIQAKLKHRAVDREFEEKNKDQDTEKAPSGIILFACLLVSSALLITAVTYIAIRNPFNLVVFTATFIGFIFLFTGFVELITSLDLSQYVRWKFKIMLFIVLIVSALLGGMAIGKSL